MGMRRPKDFPPGERKLRYVLYDLCVDWGYCIPPADAERITKFKEITAEEFAIEVLRAEGIAPEHERELVRKIAGVFVARIGSESFVATEEHPS
jgi:hypothetical protein